MPEPDDDIRIVPAEAEVPGVLDLGHRPDMARVRRSVAAGERVLVRCEPPDGPAEPAAVVAATAVYAWEGVRVFATANPAEVRDAVRMVMVIAGERPPAVARRGLA